MKICNYSLNNFAQKVKCIQHDPNYLIAKSKLTDVIFLTVNYVNFGSHLSKLNMNFISLKIRHSSVTNVNKNL